MNLTMATTPFADRKPGTSCLRKKVRTFQQPDDAADFIHLVFDALDDFSEQTLVLGGDGRFLSREAIQTAIRMVAANGLGGVLVGRRPLRATSSANMERSAVYRGSLERRTDPDRGVTSMPQDHDWF